MSERIDQTPQEAIEPHVSPRLARAGGAAMAGGAALMIAAGAALWASEGARVFVESAFSAVLACL